MSDRSASASAADPLPLPAGEGRGESAGVTAGLPSSAGCDIGLQCTTVNEGELLAQAAGNSAAFDRLVTVHEARIARLVHRLLGWPSDVDDVVQDVFVDVLRNLKRFDGRSSVLTWLTRIAINRCRSHQRKQWLRVAFLRRHVVESLRDSHSASRRDAPTCDAEQKETAQQVHHAIQQLKQRDREIIVLRYLEELPVEIIAKTLGCSRGTIDVRLSRARGRLENILKRVFDK